MSEPSILVADADEKLGRVLKRLIETEYGYQVSLPRSFDDLKECLAFQTFDSAIIDLDLSKWGRPYRINGHSIQNGRSLADLFRLLHAGPTVCLYGTKAKFEELGINPNESGGSDEVRITIPFPPSMEGIKARLKPALDPALKPVLKAVRSVHRANPLFQPLGNPKHMRMEQFLRAYKRACSLNSEWLNFNFEIVGDLSWSVVCGGSIERNWYGSPLNGHGHKYAEFGVKPRKKYPGDRERERIANSRKSYPFFFWNTRDVQFLIRQFKIAGPGLSHLPEGLRNNFGIDVARPCANAYVADMRDQVIQWCKRLTHVGQLETVSQILKKLYYHRPGWIKDFLGRCREAELPVPIEIYKGRLESIEKDRETGWVALTKWDESRAPLMEPFDLKILQQNGIEREDQSFEYTVYIPFVGGGSASKIERIESDDGNYLDVEMRRTA